ncbi:extracellular solute-binding protein [Paenibacillus oryzisoli]|uniref:extracellular solute-binding protein n=1 Tax=Paenibacillus oryzisoli TaxID=1850517 RepID=UPI003D2798DA
MRRQSEFRYSRLASILREQIYSGFIKPGEFLMSENELCRYYQVSRSSVRKSLLELLKEGLIVKRPGQGTFVSPDLVIPDDHRKVLRIMATTPSHFVDTCMPLLIEEFTQAHPNVDVKLLNISHLNFWDMIRSSSDMGLQPDLIFVTDRQFHDADQIGHFIDLNGILGEELQSVYPRMVSAFTQNEEVRAVPVTFSTVYLAYNPELFAQGGVEAPNAGWTLAEFTEAAERLTLDSDGDGIIDQYGFSLSSSISRWPVIALQNQVDFTNTTNSDPFQKTLAYIRDLIYRHRAVTLYQPYRYRINSDAFMKGKAAMVLTTAIEVAGWRNEGMAFEPKIAPLPFGELKSTLLVSNAFMLSQEAAEPELAALFLKHMYRQDVQERLTARTRFLSALHPVNSSLWELPHLASINVVDDQIKDAYFLHEIFSEVHIAEELENELELYWAGLEHPAQLIKRLEHYLSETPDSKS